MKYVNQKKYPDMPYITKCALEDEAARDQGKHTTVATSGCGLATAMMMVDRLLINTDFSLEDAIQMSYDIKANHGIGTDYEIFAPALAERFGLELEMTNDPKRLQFCLRTGGCAVVRTCGDRDGYIGVFSHVSHYVLAIAEQKDGRIVILDPSLLPGRYDEEGRREKVEVKDGFCISELKYLVEDMYTKAPPLYLFWRK